MLPKKNRADKKVVERIFKEGKFINFLNLTFKFILSPQSPTPQISVVVPKSVAKLAVKRNLLRRCGYKALLNNQQHFPPGILGVLVFKKYNDDVSILENEIKKIFDKIH